MARFLCGISSPALAAARLTRHPRFGSAGETPFADIMQAAEAALAGGT
jgi:ATP-dependent DNA helicase RecQ